MSDSFCAHAQESALILANVDIDNTLGITYIGGVLSCMIYGVTCIQTFQYYRSQRSKTDHWYLKNIIALLLVLDSVHQALIIQGTYYYLITNYANPFSLLRASWTIPTGLIINGGIAFVVESFFVRGIWKLGHNCYVTAIAMLLTVTHFAMVIWFSIEEFFNSDFPEGAERLKTTGSSGLVVAVVTDVFISATMVGYLHKSKTGIRSSNDMIGRIIALTVTTNSLPTAVVVINLITYQLWPERLYNLAVNFLLGKLYINAILTSLNARTFLRKGDGGCTDGGPSIELAFAECARSGHTGRYTRSHRQLNIPPAQSLDDCNRQMFNDMAGFSEVPTAV